MKHNAYFRLLQSLIIFLLCQCCFASIASNSITANKTDYYKERPHLGGQAAILNMQTSYSEQKSETYFKINVPAEGDYYLHFWAIIPKTKSGVYTKYKVQINGVLINETINATSNEWHYAPLSGSGKAHLKQGINSIKVIGTPTNFPKVELVYVSKIGAIPKVNGYNKLKTAISMQNPLTPYPGNAKISTTEKSTTNEPALNEYEYFNGTGIYTFTTQVYIQQGQTISVKSKSLGEKPHVLEVFGRNYKDYSWAVKSNGSEQLTFNQIAPRSGVVRIRVRTLNQGDLSFGELTINDSIVFEKVPMSNSHVISRVLPDMTYHTFTSNSSGDPVLTIEAAGSLPGKIVAYNDDDSFVHKNCTFNWGNEARITSKLSTEAQAIYISSAFSHDPYVTYELYVGCKNSDKYLRFPDLRENDPIEASRINCNGPKLGYNCFAWAGGITTDWIDPFYNETQGYKKDTELASFDCFFESRGFTREGATAENSVLDLYASSTGGREHILHAAVRKGADDHLHGYDWESKLGNSTRIFHPRYTLCGGPYTGYDSIGYGMVKYHYIRTSDVPIKSLEEEIADGTTAIEYIDFTQDENEFIDFKLHNINSDILQKFNELYREWNAVCINTHQSRMDIIADCDTYRRLLKHLQKYPDLKYAILNELANKQLAAIKPFKDIFPQNIETILPNIQRQDNKENEIGSVKIYRPIMSTLTGVAKGIVHADMKNANVIIPSSLNSDTTDSTLSNSIAFKVNLNSQNCITTTFSIEKTADIVIQIKDLGGNICYTRAKGICSQGDYTESIPFNSKGTFLVCLIVNNKLNVKKIIM